MPLTYLGSDLVTAIRNIGMVPSTGSEGTQDADLLRWASEGIRSYIFPSVIELLEEYGIFRTRTTIVSGTQRYRLPHRAAWQMLRDLWLFDGTNRREIYKLPEEGLGGAGTSGSGQPTHYLIEGNLVVLIPDLSGSYTGSLEMVFYVRPGDLILETAARQIPAGGINTATKTVTFSSAIPSTWTTTSRFDVHSQYSGAELKSLNEAVTAASGSALTFTNAINGSAFGTMALEEGDWVCLTGEAVLPALPAELHPIVARGAAMQVAEGIGDTDKVKLHGTILDTFLKKTLGMMQQRVQSKPMRLGSVGLLGRQRRFGGW